MRTDIIQTAVTVKETDEAQANDIDPTGFFVSAQFDPYVDTAPADEALNRQNKWSVSWADLMMTMFVLFAVLYAYQVGNQRLVLGDGPGRNTFSESGASQVADINALQNPADIYDQAKSAILDEFVDESVGVDMVADQAVRISIAGDILFDTGKATLLPQARERLWQIASVLRGNNYIINVSGHTDAMPSYSAKYPTNWELSAARATNTARFLIEKGGVSEDRFFISAHAWHQPVRPNTSIMNRRQNRRVEIILMKTRPYLKDASEGQWP